MTEHERMNYWWQRALQAEARVKAVKDVLDQDAPDPTIATRVRSDTIRRALDGDSANRK